MLQCIKKNFSCFYRIPHRLCLILFAALFPLVSITHCHATPFFSATVTSSYYIARTGTWGSKVSWNFIKSAEHEISVYKDDTGEPVMILSYGSTGKIELVRKRLARGDGFVEISEKVSGDIVLSSGFPVPYDQLLPYEEITGSGSILLKKNIAGLTFSSPLTEKIVPLTTARAMTAEMIDQQVADRIGNKQLRLLVILQNDELVVRQLWAAGDDFWLYEETPERKSRRLAFSHVP